MLPHLSWIKKGEGDLPPLPHILLLRLSSI